MIRLVLFLFFCSNMLYAQDFLLQETKLVDCYIPNNNSHVYMKLKYIKILKLQRHGLMGIETLKKGQGLLIQVNDNHMGRIWMKNMLMPIDIVFLSKDGSILATIENAQPCMQEENENCSITSVKDTRYIVETSPGFIVDNYLYYSNKCVIKN